MKKIHEIQKFLAELLLKKPVIIVLSILCAVLIWFAVSVTVYSTLPISFADVPLEIDLSGTSAEANGLSMVSCNVDTVRVRIEGSRSQVGILKAEDLTAYCDVRNITSTGEYKLDISVRTDKNVSFEVKSVVPAQATVGFDRIETRSFDVEASFPNIVVTSGHTLDEVTCEPASIDITGPSAQLDEIGRVVVVSDKSIEIDSAYSLFSSDLKLYTDENAEMDTDGLEIPSTNFQINIPVLTQKRVPLTYSIVNKPTDFDEDWLRERLQLSEDTITIASQSSTAMANLETWSVGVVSLQGIDLDFSKNFTVELDEDLINQSEIDQVTLKLDPEGLTTRNYTISKENITITNYPAGYNFSVATSSLSVTVIGPEEELMELTDGSIAATVDLRNYDISTSASSSYPVTITLIDHPHLWTIGSPQVSLLREEQTTEPPETETATEE